MNTAARNDGRDWVETAFDLDVTGKQVVDPTNIHPPHDTVPTAGMVVPRSIIFRLMTPDTIAISTLAPGRTSGSSWRVIPVMLPRDGILRLIYVAFFKRAIDLVLASVLLVLLLPIMLAITIWIMVDSSGNPFYSQRRIGHRQRQFTILKFRSMVVDAHSILERNPELVAQHATHWKIIKDVRVTRCGAFLRRNSLDELPQLLNVIRGEMSIVGPRPYLPTELRDEYGKHADVITSVRPGMTGLWQVSGRSVLTPWRRIELDEQYASTCSLNLDLFVLIKTIKVVFSRHGAY